MIENETRRPGHTPRAKSEQTKVRIVHAATDIIRREGLHSCTQRAIAAELNISPGTITWHFRTLDDLHDAVIDNAVENFTAQTLTWFRECPLDKPEVQLTRFVFWTLEQHTRLLSEYELFVAAVARPRLREGAMAWLSSHSVILQERYSLDAQQAAAIVAYTDAWLLRSLISDGADKPDGPMMERIFLSILEAS